MSLFKLKGALQLVSISDLRPPGARLVLHHHLHIFCVVIMFKRHKNQKCYSNLKPGLPAAESDGSRT